MSDETRFYDGETEVFPCTINSICPIERLDAAKLIAHAHMIQYEQNPTAIVAEMLPVLLGPIEGGEATHAFCTRNGFCHQVRMLEEHLAALPQEWIGERLYTLEDSPEEIRGLFCVVVGDPDALLAHLGLRRVN